MPVTTALLDFTTYLTPNANYQGHQKSQVSISVTIPQMFDQNSAESKRSFSEKKKNYSS